jgi:hypothetical protein
MLFDAAHRNVIEALASDSRGPAGIDVAAVLARRGTILA